MIKKGKTSKKNGEKNNVYHWINHRSIYEP